MKRDRIKVGDRMTLNTGLRAGLIATVDRVSGTPDNPIYHGICPTLGRRVSWHWRTVWRYPREEDA